VSRKVGDDSAKKFNCDIKTANGKNQGMVYSKGVS